MHCVVSIPQLLGETSPGVISLSAGCAPTKSCHALEPCRERSPVWGGGTHDDERRGKGLDAKRGREAVARVCTAVREGKPRGGFACSRLRVTCSLRGRLLRRVRLLPGGSCRAAGGGSVRSVLFLHQQKKGRGEEQEAKNDFEANWPKAPERYPSSAPPAGEPCSRSSVQAV